MQILKDFSTMWAENFVDEKAFSGTMKLDLDATLLAREIMICQECM